MKPINECQTLQELFCVPERWTQDATFRDINGNSTLVSSKAHSFCLMGGCNILRNNGYTIAANNALNKLIDAISTNMIASFNDNKNTTFTDIRNLIEKLSI